MLAEKVVSLPRRGIAAPGALYGIDVHVESDLTPDALAARVEPLAASLPLRLDGVSAGESGAYRCRFVTTLPRWPVSEGDLIALLYRVARSVRWMRAEKLHRAVPRDFPASKGPA